MVPGIKNTAQDVWKYIDKKGEDDCWNWMRCLDVFGYGQITIDYKVYKCHRIVYELVYSIIPNGLLVLHHCDNPKCCNPKHLWLGNHDDNINDMVKKGRQRRGENVNTCKLTEQQVLKIRELYSMGEYSHAQIAKMYNVTKQLITSILNYKIWKHLPRG